MFFNSVCCDTHFFFIVCVVIHIFYIFFLVCVVIHNFFLIVYIFTSCDDLFLVGYLLLLFCGFHVRVDTVITRV